MTLSLSLGIPLRECLQRIDSQEYAVYRAMYEIDPWGSRRADWQAGVIAAVIANQHATDESLAARPDDFMLDVEREPDENPEPEQTDEDIEQFFRIRARQMQQGR